MKNKYFVLLLIVIFSVWLKSANLSNRYIFDWDQTDDATKVMTMVWERKPTLLGPRVSTENGFFTGPYYYYFLLPFYLATSGNPIAGAMAAIFIGALSTTLTFFVAEKFYGKGVGFLASIIVASSVSTISWNAMLITPLSLIGYYLCHQLLKSDRLLIPAALFASLASSIHLVVAPITGCFVAGIIVSKKRIPFKTIIYGLLALLVFFVPTIIFDIRHQFLNFNKILEFAGGRMTSEIYPTWLFLRTFWRSLVISGYGFEKIIILIALCYGVYKQKDIQSKIITLIWILLPILLLSQYKGNIPEYYYGMVTSLAPLFIAKLFVDLLSIWIILPLVGVLIYSQIQFVLHDRAFITLSDKLNVVKYIVNQKEYPIFNVSYDLPLGYNTGYQYIFKYLKHEPYSGPEGHLFSIALSSKENEEFVYTSGNIGVIKR